MSRAGVVPPPPWSPPTEIIEPRTDDCAYHFVRFDGEYRNDEQRADLLIGLRNLPETIMLIETSQGFGDIYVLMQSPRDMASVDKLSDWIDRMAGQRIYNMVRSGWVKVGAEMIRFAK